METSLLHVGDLIQLSHLTFLPLCFNIILCCLDPWLLCIQLLHYVIMTSPVDYIYWGMMLGLKLLQLFCELWLNKDSTALSDYDITVKCWDPHRCVHYTVTYYHYNLNIALEEPKCTKQSDVKVFVTLHTVFFRSDTAATIFRCLFWCGYHLRAATIWGQCLFCLGNWRIVTMTLIIRYMRVIQLGLIEAGTCSKYMQPFSPVVSRGNES